MHLDFPSHTRYTFDHLRRLTTPPADLNPYQQRVLTFCRDWLAGQAEFTLHTSGSTGAPKPITLTREQMVISARLTGEALGLQAGDPALVCLSTDYIAGRMMLVRGLELGLPLTVIEPRSNPLADFRPDARFAFTAMVPLQMQTILNDSPEKILILERMKGILLGGAPVGAVMEADLQTLSVPVYHTYGMTETVTHIALRRLNGPQAGPAFIPFPGVRLGLDERGCLTISAPVTLGKTLVTNDLVDLRSDGAFVWLGRVDNVINSGGVKVQVEQVEAAIERVLLDFEGGRHAGRRFFVGPLPDPRLGQMVVAVFEGTPPADPAALETALRAQLPRFQAPRRFFYLDRLAETPTGKIDRGANLARLR